MNGDERNQQLMEQVSAKLGKPLTEVYDKAKIGRIISKDTPKFKSAMKKLAPKHGVENPSFFTGTNSLGVSGIVRGDRKAADNASEKLSSDLRDAIGRGGLKGAVIRIEQPSKTKDGFKISVEIAFHSDMDE